MKKKKKKHQRLTRVLNSAVKIRTQILEEDITWKGIHAINAAKYLDKMSKKNREAVTRAYKKLFERNLVLDMADALCTWDDYYEELEKTTNPPKAGK